MSNNPIRRIAYIKLSPQGKSYAMRCDRTDLGVGDQVEVHMYIGTDRAYYDDGVITGISHQRWDCSCHVVNHISEVDYSFDDSGFNRVVSEAPRKDLSPNAWRAQKAPYLRLVSDSTKSNRSGLRDAESEAEAGNEE